MQINNISFIILMVLTNITEFYDSSIYLYRYNIFNKIKNEHY